jgi:hypothetical protein
MRIVLVGVVVGGEKFIRSGVQAQSPGHEKEEVDGQFGLLKAAH